MILAETLPDTANSSLKGMININNGNASTKNNSSRNKDITVIAELSPNLIPSLWINSISNAEPPAADGVIAEVNSYNILTLKRDAKRSFFPDSRYKRHIPHKSLVQARSKARKRNSTVQPSKYDNKSLFASVREENSDWNIHAIANKPIATGKMMCELFKLFATLSF